MSLKVQVEGMDVLKSRLGNISRRAPSVMRMSINDTAKKARTDLRTKAQKTYKVKARGINQEMNMRPATNSNLEAILKARGAPIPLSQFEYSRNTIKRGNPAKAHQLVETSKKMLFKNGNKGFVATMRNGKAETKHWHDGIFYRNGKRMRNKNKEAISEFFGSSVPSMLGGKRVYGELEPQIQRNLEYNIERHILRLVGGR